MEVKESAKKRNHILEKKENWDYEKNHTDGFDPLDYTDMETYFCPECHAKPCSCVDNI